MQLTLFVGVDFLADVPMTLALLFEWNFEAGTSFDFDFLDLFFVGKVTLEKKKKPNGSITNS